MVVVAPVCDSLSSLMLSKYPFMYIQKLSLRFYYFTASTHSREMWWRRVENGDDDDDEGWNATLNPSYNEIFDTVT